MIGIYANDDTTRLGMGYRGVTINSAAYEVGSAVINHQYDAVTEPKAQANGMESYDPRQLVTMIRIDGTVKGESVAQLHDRIEALNEAFDPFLAADADTEDRNGYLPFTFSVPTEDTANYPSGLIPMQYYARSVALPVERVSKFEGHAARFTILLQAVDPRRYLQTESSLSVTSTSQTLDNSLATYRSYPVLTVTMSGAGPSAWDINADQDTWAALRLNLSTLVNGDVVVVDMARREIKVNGVVNQGLYVSGGYLYLEPMSQQVGRSSVSTNIASSVLTWRRAFV